MKYMLNTKILDDVVFGDMEDESALNRLWSNVRGLFRRYDSSAQKCMSVQETLHRFLRKEQIRGLISKSVNFSQFQEQGLNLSRDDVEKFIIDKYKEDGDKTQRKLNRKEALIEAYSQTPMKDMMKLQKRYKPDFDMFGYDPQPAELFGENVRSGYIKKFYFS